MNMVNIVNFVNMWKTDKFTAYLHESKGPVNIVYISQGYFDSCRPLVSAGVQLKLVSLATDNCQLPTAFNVSVAFLPDHVHGRRDAHGQPRPNAYVRALLAPL